MREYLRGLIMDNADRNKLLVEYQKLLKRLDSAENWAMFDFYIHFRQILTDYSERSDDNSADKQKDNYERRVTCYNVSTTNEFSDKLFEQKDKRACANQNSKNTQNL